MALLDLFKKPEKERSHPIGLDEWANMFSYMGGHYGFNPFGGGTLAGEKLSPPSDFAGYVSQVYKENGVVFACMLVRMLLFSEARFMFRQLHNGRPGDLHSNQNLNILHKPWTGGTSGDLLTRIIQDADLQGDSFTLRRPRRLGRLRPDWVTVLYGSPSGEDMWDVDAELLGYAYHPGGIRAGRDPVFFGPEQIAHFMPVPDPASPGRGMSWLTPVLREVMGDSAATSHKLRFFENGATPNMVVSFPENVGKDAFDRWVEKFDDQNTGSLNAYKTLYLGAAAKAEVIGSDFKQMDFKITQGHGETRVAAAAGVPPVIVGLSEGLQAATYSNYGQARRRFADGTMRPLWRNLVGSMARIVNVPWDSELWYDDRDVPFLQEDRKDAADIQQVQAISIKALADSGFTPDSAVKAVTSEDLRLLEHSGLQSVQLQPIGSTNGSPKLPALQGGADGQE